MKLFSTPCIRFYVRTAWLFSALLFASPIASAQEENRYAAGAVPVEEGKATFSKEIQVPTLTQEQIFELAEKWAGARFVKTEETNGKVLYTDRTAGEIACRGDEWLTFKQSALVLDRSRITYRMILICSPGVCKVKINNIRYAYQVASNSVPDLYAAEELITDEYALNKKKNKLLRSIGKFRTHTVDLAEELFDSLEAALSAP